MSLTLTSRLATFCKTGNVFSPQEPLVVAHYNSFSPGALTLTGLGAPSGNPDGASGQPPDYDLFDATVFNALAAETSWQKTHVALTTMAPVSDYTASLTVAGVPALGLTVYECLETLEINNDDYIDPDPGKGTYIFFHGVTDAGAQISPHQIGSARINVRDLGDPPENGVWTAELNPNGILSEAAVQAALPSSGTIIVGAAFVLVSGSGSGSTIEGHGLIPGVTIKVKTFAAFAIL